MCYNNLFKSIRLRINYIEFLEGIYLNFLCNSNILDVCVFTKLILIL